MNNNTDHIISNENAVPPPVAFIKWPLDMDDDEFRAGYPFTSAPLEEMNEQTTWYVGSSTSNDDAIRSVNPQNNDCNKITKEDDESSRFLFRALDEPMKFDDNSSQIHDDNNGYTVHLNQQKDHEEDKRNQYDQYNIVATDSVNDKQTNQVHPAK